MAHPDASIPNGQTFESTAREDRRHRVPARAARLITVAAASLLAACAASQSPAPLLLTLPAVPEAANPPAASASATGSLVVRRLTLPEYIVSRRVRYRSGSSTLAEWPNTFWGERVEIGAARTLLSALHRQLPGWNLCDVNCDDSAAGTAIQVDVVALDYMRSQQRLSAQVRLTCRVANVTPPGVWPRELQYELATGADTPQAQAQAMGELMQRVAADVASLVHGSCS